MTRCVKHKFRLTRSTDFKRVRRFGKSYAHPLIVLVALPNDLGKSRLAVSAGRSLGGAVERNRAKRLLREAIRPNIPSVMPGWDCLFLARQSILTAPFQHITTAVTIFYAWRVYGKKLMSVDLTPIKTRHARLPSTKASLNCLRDHSS
jgi:ribonuclease P protein component